MLCSIIEHAALPVPPNMDKEAEVVQWKSSEYSPK